MRPFSTAAFLLAATALPLGAAPSAAENLVPASAIAAMVSGPLDGDAFAYRAVLVDVEDGADLYLFVEDTDGRHLAAHAPSIAWRGEMFGTRPSLEASANGSLKVMSGNDSVGRDRWNETLTIAYRGGRFVVAGFTWNTWDTLEPGHTSSCDVNLLSGKAIIDGKHTVKTTMKARPVEEWAMDTKPPECQG